MKCSNDLLALPDILKAPYPLSSSPLRPPILEFPCLSLRRIREAQCVSNLSRTRRRLEWLFLSGLRAQNTLPVVSLEPSIIADSVEGGEGISSPMLTVVGLNLKDLERRVAATNEYLPDNSKLYISLHNSVKAIVITCPSRTLHYCSPQSTRSLWS